MIHIIQQSSLEKISSKAQLSAKPFHSATVIQGEQFAFQIALYSDQVHGETITFSKQLPLRHKLFLVKQTAVNWPHYASDLKNDYLLDTPGLLPDALIPLKRTKLRINQNVTVIWVHLYTDFPGKVNISFRFDSEDEELVSTFELNILPISLPASDFTYTQYIDPWGIADSYRVPIYSHIVWDQLKNYFDLAYDMGTSAVVAPLFPAVYSGNATVKPTQLFRVEEIGKQYVFNFDRFDSWLFALNKAYLRDIIIPPIFPSFETLKCPDIQIELYKNERPLFRPAAKITSPEYLEFMQTLLRKFIQHLKEISFGGKVHFQLTFDPRMEDLPVYREFRISILHAIGKDRVMDGVLSRKVYDCDHHSAPTFYLHDADDFSDISAKNKSILFDIYSEKDFCNQLIAAPSARLRSLGAFCYFHGISGLLNLNINNCTNLYGEAIDPYADTDNENAFPSGSGHLYYPSIQGPITSIRAMQILFAIQDIRVFKLLESLTSQKEVLSMIQQEMNFQNKDSVITPEAFWNFKHKICQLIIDKSEE